MDEYISREALMRDMRESLIFSVRDGVIGGEIRGANKVIDRIKAAPTADVVEVVRCEKCKYGKSYDDGVSFVCNKDVWVTAAHGDHFCSYGKQKDGADAD